MDCAALPAGVRIVFVQGFQETQVLGRDQQLDTLQAPVFQIPQKFVPAFPFFPASFRYTHSFAIASRFTPIRPQNGNRFDFTAHVRLSQMPSTNT